MDPLNKTCQLMFFLYSLHYESWERDWVGELRIEDKQVLQFLSPFQLALNMGAIHAYQKREDKKQGSYKLYLG